MFSVSFVHPLFFLQEAQLITVVTGAGALILGSFQAFCSIIDIIDIKPLAFFRLKLADWRNSDRSSKQYYLLAR
jgi:hypothetical protein